MIFGPLEYILLGFEGNHFTNQILPQLRAAQEEGIITVIDLIFLMKDENGNVTVTELREMGDPEADQYSFIASSLRSILDADDIETAANSLPNNTSAGLLLFEHTWAINLKDAVLNAGGKVLAGGRIDAEAMEALEAEFDAETAASGTQR